MLYNTEMIVTNITNYLTTIKQADNPVFIIIDKIQTICIIWIK